MGHLILEEPCFPMSKNDELHLQANFDNWLRERGEGLSAADPFSYYCVENFLKPFDLSDEEILMGSLLVAITTAA